MSLSQLAKKFKNIKTGDQVEKTIRIPTGIAGLDIILNGGIPVGRMMQITGKASSGKTALLLNMINSVLEQNEEAEAAYADIEKTVDFRDVDVNIKAKDRFCYLKTYSAEETVEFLQAAMQEGACIGGLDSVPHMYPKDTLDKMLKDPSYKSIAPAAGYMARMSPIITNLCSLHNFTLIVINQVRPGDNIYSALKVTGGASVEYALSAWIHITKVAKDKEDPERMVQSLVGKKMKNGIPLLTTELTMVNSVVQRGESLIAEGVKTGYITKAGAHFSLSPLACEALGCEALKLGAGTIKAGAAIEQFQHYNKLYDLVVQDAIHKYLPEEENQSGEEIVDLG